MYSIYSLCLSVLCMLVIVQSGQYSNNALIYTGTTPLALSNGITIGGPIFGNQNLSLTGGCKIGDATIVGDITIDGGSTAGNIVASRSVTIIGGSVVTSVTQNAMVTPTTIVGVSTLQIPTANATTDYQTITINPGCYNILSVGSGGTINLNPGTYSFNSFTGVGGGTINFLSSSNRVVVTVHGDINLGSGVRLTGDPSRNVLLVSGNVNIQADVNNVTIFAPNGQVYLSSGANINGGVYAKQVNLTSGNVITRTTYNGYSVSAGTTYNVASVTRNVNHLSTTIPVTYYYPSNSPSGQNFPVYVWHQGFNCPASYYSSYASKVAAYGYVVAVPNYLQSFVFGGQPFTVYFPTSRTINSIEDDIRNNGGFPANPDIMLTGGHSQGGVSALYALAPNCTTDIVCEGFVRRNTLKGAVVFGTNNRNQTASPDSFLDTPVDGRFIAYLQGAIDGRALPSRTQGTFDVTTGTNRRALAYYDGMNHYGITDVTSVPGATPDSNTETGDHTQGLTYLARDTHLFIKGYLNNDVAITQYYLAGYRDDPKYSSNIQIQHSCS